MPNVQLAVTMSDGTVTVTTFITESRSPTLPSGAVWNSEEGTRWTRPANAQNIAAELAKAFPPVNGIGLPRPTPISWRVIHPSAVPADRTYRNAWRDVGGVIAHDLAAAKEIHRHRLRKARVTPLAELDAAYLRADEAGDLEAKARIVAKKQALRDLPADPRIEAAQTIDELKQVWVDDLNG